MNSCFMAGLAFVAFMTGAAYFAIGKTYTGGVYDWQLPLQVLLCCGLPFVFGFIAGKRKKD